MKAICTFIITALILFKVTHSSEDCNSRLVFDEIQPGKVLEGAVKIKTTITSTHFSCLGICIHHSGNCEAMCYDSLAQTCDIYNVDQLISDGPMATNNLKCMRKHENEFEKWCQQNPCLNGGTCIATCSSPYYRCQCFQSEGEHCETPTIPLQYTSYEDIPTSDSLHALYDKVVGCTLTNHALHQFRYEINENVVPKKGRYAYSCLLTHTSCTTTGLNDQGNSGVFSSLNELKYHKFYCADSQLLYGFTFFENNANGLYEGESKKACCTPTSGSLTCAQKRVNPTGSLSISGEDVEQLKYFDVKCDAGKFLQKFEFRFKEGNDQESYYLITCCQLSFVAG